MLKKSDYFILSAATISLALSAFLWTEGKADSALFVGLWVPAILGFGTYLKISIGR